MRLSTISPALCLSIAFAFVSVSSHADGGTCSAALAQTADAAIDHLNHWADLLRFYRRFAPCDDGSISEGVSESIARLLVDRPATLASAAEVLLKNSAFRRFVVRHIDSTLNTEDLTRIESFSPAACPVQLTQMCEEMRAAARRALKSGA